MSLNLTEDLYVDLNGYTMSGTIVTNGYKIYGMDSTTDAYTCDSMGYFQCVDENGEEIMPVTQFKTTEELTGSVRRYLSIETEQGYTFHRFYLGVTAASLKPSVTGVGYKAIFCGDDMVKSQLDDQNAFGYSLQLAGGRKMTMFKDADSFVSGRTVTLRLNRYDVQNYGETALNASVCLQLADGTVIESALHTQTMRSMIESINAAVEAYTEEQLEAIREMIDLNPIMNNWQIENLLDRSGVDIPVEDNPEGGLW